MRSPEIDTRRSKRSKMTHRSGHGSGSRKLLALSAVAALALAMGGLVGTVDATPAPVLAGSSSGVEVRTVEDAFLDRRHGGHEMEGEEMEHAPSHSIAPSLPSSSPSPKKPPPHSHGHSHAAPLLQLDEEEVLRYHDPDPESYWDWDFGTRFEGSPTMEQVGGRGGLMLAHTVGMILAFFGALPLSIVLRIAHHPLQTVFTLVFIGLLALSLFFSFLYTSFVPNHYEGAAHGTIGWVMVFIVALLKGGELFHLVYRARKAFAEGSGWIRVLLGGKSRREEGDEYERVALRDFELEDDEDRADMTEVNASDLRKRLEEEDNQVRDQHHVMGSASSTPETNQNPRFSPNLVQGQNPIEEGSWANSAPSTQRRKGHQPELSLNILPALRRDSSTSGSQSSDETLHDGQHNSTYEPSSAFPKGRNLGGSGGVKKSRSDRLKVFVKFGSIFLERTLVMMAFVQFVTGVVTYFGFGRGAYGNGVLAHTIKGGIFFWFGLLTFARYIGAFAELGWAWNRKTSSIPSHPSQNETQQSRIQVAKGKLRENLPSAEFVESAVICFYGATNTWMERFGAGPNDPYSVKDVQHISIAVMFWWAGLLGMLLESKRVRNFLSFPVINRSGRSAESISQPPSYAFSFNPFPALVIGVTGIAMAAHHQTYQFQVDIHALWGNLLGGYSALRFLTYFFLWLRPPTSILPSRPPTEALASFSLTCGGMVFILSTEQITFAAMRHGFDDMMAFLNLTVAFVSVVFAWILVLFAIRGWAETRMATTRNGAEPFPRAAGATSGRDGNSTLVQSPGAASAEV